MCSLGRRSPTCWRRAPAHRGNTRASSPRSSSAACGARGTRRFDKETERPVEPAARAVLRAEEDQPAGRAPPSLELFEVPLNFPIRYLRPVLVPLGALGVDEVAEHVVAERLANDAVLLELVE